MSVTQRLRDLASGRIRMLTLRERVEIEFAEFCAWLLSKGGGQAYYAYTKETWDLMLWQRDYAAFTQAQQKKAHADQQFAELVKLLKDPAASKTAILAAVMSWAQEQRDDLVALLTPPILADELPVAGEQSR